MTAMNVEEEPHPVNSNCAAEGGQSNAPDAAAWTAQRAMHSTGSHIHNPFTTELDMRLKMRALAGKYTMSANPYLDRGRPTRAPTPQPFWVIYQRDPGQPTRVAKRKLQYTNFDLSLIHISEPTRPY